MYKVYICSPYASRGSIEENIKKAQEYSRRAVLRNFIPVTPHIYFTQFMDDAVEWEREWALAVGLQLLEECKYMWVFGSPTGGMIAEIEKARKLGIPILHYGEDA